MQSACQTDGPYGIFGWKQNDVVVDGAMQPKTWELAKYLYERRNKFIPISELVGFSNLFDNEDIADESVKRQGSKISKWFRVRDIPLQVRTRDQHIWMEDAPLNL